MRKEWMEPVIKVQEFVANEKAERFINLSAMLLQEICTIILRAMVKLMEPTMALEEQDL